MRVAQQHHRGVEQFIKRLHHYHRLAQQERRGSGVVTGQCAGVRLRGLAGSGTSPGHQQHQWFASGARLGGQFQKDLWAAYLLRIHRDHACLGVADECGQHVFNAYRDLVTRRKNRGYWHASTQISIAQVGRHKATLRHHAHTGTCFRFARNQRLKRDRNACSQVGEPHAIGAHQQDPHFLSHTREFSLLVLTFLSSLCVTRCKKYGRLAMTSSQSLHRVQYARFGNGHHSQINALRKFIHRFDTRAAIDFFAAAADQVQITTVAKTLQIALHKTTKRTWVCRGPNDHDGSWMDDVMYILNAIHGICRQGARVGHGKKNLVTNQNQKICTPRSFIS